MAYSSIPTISNCRVLFIETRRYDEHIWYVVKADDLEIMTVHGEGGKHTPFIATDQPSHLIISSSKENT